MRRPKKKLSTAETIRQAIEKGEGYFRQQDFESLSPGAVSQTLSRLARQGMLQRISKGIYYRPRDTAFGKSRSSPGAIRQLPVARKSVFPAGLSAANLLGFTTQNPSRNEFATAATSFPRAILGKNTRLHTRRPEAWNDLSQTDAAILDFIRQRGAMSELSPGETIRRLLAYFREGDRFERLAKVAVAEPPRVRAILGAIGQELRTDVTSLRASLNPLSRYDFGVLSGLRHAGEWQVKAFRKENSTK